MKNTSASEVAETFVHEWVFNYGSTEKLLPDNGKCFTAKFFQKICHILSIHKPSTATYREQTDGQTKLLKHILEAATRSYLDDHPTDWVLYTPSSAYTYRCLLHKTAASIASELVLLRPQPPPTLKAYPKEYSTPQEAKNK